MSRVALVLLATLGACRFDSSVRNKAVLAELEGDDYCALRIELQEWEKRVYAEDFCYVSGQLAGADAEVAGRDFREACEATFDTCLADAQPENFEPTCFGTAFEPSCQATVREVERCVRGLARNLRSAGASKCSPISREEALDRGTSWYLVDACDVVEAACPPWNF